MKLLALFFTTIILTPAFADIAPGRYQVDQIQCHKSKKVLSLGGKFMVYTIFMDITDTEMTMTAHAKSGSWAPFKLDCTQINQGTYAYTQEGKYEGELPNISVKCNADTWTSILKKKLFGVEEYGEFNYVVDGDKLTIFNPDTVTKYSCDSEGDYPIYTYKKI